MGAWDPGNFDNDAALDMVESVLEVATSEIKAFCVSRRSRVEDLDALMACVAVHLALHQHCHSSPPDPALASTLRSKVLSIYDDQIDSLDPEPAYKAARRAILLETLERYEKAANANG